MNLLAQSCINLCLVLVQSLISATRNNRARAAKNYKRGDSSDTAVSRRVRIGARTHALARLVCTCACMRLTTHINL